MERNDAITAPKQGRREPANPADLAGSIPGAGLEVNQGVSQNDLVWEKSEVEERLYGKEKQPGKVISA